MGSDLYEKRETSSSHSTIILSLVNALLQKACLDAKDLDVVAVTQGPGSFTGLRVGIAVAQGLAYAHDTLTLPLSSLRLTAWEWFRTETLAVRESRYVLATMDARMSQLYAAWFKISVDSEGALDPSKLQLLSEESVLSPENITSLGFSPGRLSDSQNGLAIQHTGKYVLAGSGAQYRHRFPDEVLREAFDIAEEIQPSAIGMLEYLSCFSADEIENLCIDAKDLTPVYIRNDVTS